MSASPNGNASNGYEEHAERFMSSRNPHIGVATVRDWSATLRPGCSILDLGCGNGVPISKALIDEGFAVYGVDASAKMIAAFRYRFPNSQAECADVANSEFFNRKFDAVIAWGLLFLLPSDIQASIIGKVARTLNHGGQFLFTSPRGAVTWRDVLTGGQSSSLGSEGYQKVFLTEGLLLTGEKFDEGDNHYYLVLKP